jgi:hypothetical protein
VWAVCCMAPCVVSGGVWRALVGGCGVSVAAPLLLLLLVLLLPPCLCAHVHVLW